MQSTDSLDDIVAFYRHFARTEAKGESATFAAWADELAEDDEVLRLLQELPVPKRQPNLVFAAGRWHGAAAPGPYSGLRTVLVEQWGAVRATILERATQTNEVGRCAALLPVLAGLPGPLALLEVGASGGLCLHPDRYSYRYTDAHGIAVRGLDPVDGPSPVVLGCRVHGEAPLPSRLPDVAWRGGIDLHPVDLTDEGEARWLETLVWPEHEDRRRRLAAAVEAVAEVPVDVVEGDLLRDLPPLVARAREAAPEATLVILHTAVLAYLDAEGRRRWPDLVTGVVEEVRAGGGRAHWVSNEGGEVLPGVTATATCVGSESDFCLALDGQALGWAHGHGRRVTWC